VALDVTDAAELYDIKMFYLDTIHVVKKSYIFPNSPKFVVQSVCSPAARLFIMTGNM